jgi:protein involved in polysaccharide export with SLBB domain
MNREVKSKWGFFLLFFVISQIYLIPAFSQEEKEKYPQRQRAAQYILGPEDELLIKVNIWGFVQKPGQYLVPTDTDLISLISFAGGPREEAKIKNIKIIRNSAEKDKVIKINVKKYLETGDENLIPSLMPGDTIVVSGTTLHFISKFFDFTYRVAMLVQIYAWIQYYSTH